MLMLRFWLIEYMIYYNGIASTCRYSIYKKAFVNDTTGQYLETCYLYMKTLLDVVYRSSNPPLWIGGSHIPFHCG